MTKVLYLTNIETPYRVRFFNELAKVCDLSVMYERRKSANRDAKWASSVQKTFNVEFLDGKEIGNEYSFSFGITKILKRHWDVVIVGCYNSYVQIFAMMYMKLHKIPYIVNLDGEQFFDNGLKSAIKRMLLKSGDAILAAGVKSASTTTNAIKGKKTVYPYHFSSLSDAEIIGNGQTTTIQRADYVLVVGQYFDYKGMDVAFRVACKDRSIRYKFVGLGSRTEQFISDMGCIPDNIEIIPFLQKEDLNNEYKRCALMLLPTRQECWGLVVNEAASFGTPIVSTYGSGAAVEFLSDKYTKYLAEPNDVDSLYSCVRQCLSDNSTEYSKYLKAFSRNYSIERSVSLHAELINRFSK